MENEIIILWGIIIALSITLLYAMKRIRKESSIKNFYIEVSKKQEADLASMKDGYEHYKRLYEQEKKMLNVAIDLVIKSSPNTNFYWLLRNMAKYSDKKAAKDLLARYNQIK